MRSSGSQIRPRVLLVEDDDGVRRSMHLMLHGKGFDVRSYASAGPLLADPTAAEASLLIADYRLPDSDGFLILDALRARGWFGRAMLVTAFYDQGLRERALAHGFDAVLPKPMRQHDLMALLQPEL